MPDLVSIGECFIEMMSPDPLSVAAHFDKWYSGDTLSPLAMASRLGTSCGYITRVSDDPLGDFLLESWTSLDIDTSHVKQVRGFNAFEFSSPTSVAEGQKVYYRDGSVASSMVPEDLDAEYIGAARVLHVSTISQLISKTSQDTVLRAVEIARANDVLVSYDTNLRLHLWPAEVARQAMDEILPYVDIILPSHPHEPMALIGIDSQWEVIDYFLSKGVAIVVLKCGGEGAWVGTGERVGRVPAVAPKGVFDTASAGDTFAGGFLHCVVRGLDAFEAVRWAVVSAGLKVAGRSILGQPTLEEVEQHLGSVEVIDQPR